MVPNNRKMVLAFYWLEPSSDFNRTIYFLADNRAVCFIRLSDSFNVFADGIQCCLFRAAEFERECDSVYFSFLPIYVPNLWNGRLVKCSWYVAPEKKEQLVELAAGNRFLFAGSRFLSSIYWLHVGIILSMHHSDAT